MLLTLAVLDLIQAQPEIPPAPTPEMVFLTQAKALDLNNYWYRMIDRTPDLLIEKAMWQCDAAQGIRIIKRPQQLPRSLQQLARKHLCQAQPSR